MIAQIIVSYITIFQPRFADLSIVIFLIPIYVSPEKSFLRLLQFIIRDDAKSNLSAFSSRSSYRSRPSSLCSRRTEISARTSPGCWTWSWWEPLRKFWNGDMKWFIVRNIESGESEATCVERITSIVPSSRHFLSKQWSFHRKTFTVTFPVRQLAVLDHVLHPGLLGARILRRQALKTGRVHHGRR